MRKLDSCPVSAVDVRWQHLLRFSVGIDFWHTLSIPRVGIPSLRLSDGPNGIRGTRFFNSIPAACLPCGTALAATWDVDLLHVRIAGGVLGLFSEPCPHSFISIVLSCYGMLMVPIQEAGRLLAEEAAAKGAHVWLGPTVNTQRSPIGGRGFESFSEDPVLSGNAAAALINGCQSLGIAASIKHFVCNDQEHERSKANMLVSERALREIYLLPFQIALRDAKPMAVMTAYNRLNGLHCSDNAHLLKDVLRQEWGFDGIVMSDW